MLTIRMQRTGRKGLANFRVVVQDSRFSPSSGRVVAQLGHYNPHTKEVVLDKEKTIKYLANGAQPSPRAARLLETEKVKLPDWVKKVGSTKKRNIKNPEKLRKNRPAEAEAPANKPDEAEKAAEETAVAEAPAEPVETSQPEPETEASASEEQAAEAEPAEGAEEAEEATAAESEA